MKSPHVLTSENAKDALQDLFQARARPQHACVCVFFCLYNTEMSGAATCAMTTLTARTITQQLIINARLHSSYLTHAVGYDMKTHAVCKTCPFFFLPPPLLIFFYFLASFFFHLSSFYFLNPMTIFFASCDL